MKTVGKVVRLPVSAQDDGKGIGGAYADFWRPWATLSEQERRGHRDRALVMTLQGVPSSTKALALVEDILNRVLVPAKAVQAANGIVRPSSVLKLRTVLGAILGDLMAATNQARWGARTTKRKGDVDRAVKGTAFNDAKDALAAAGLLEHVKGHTRDAALQFSRQHVSPIFRPTQELLALAADFGVLPEAVGRHFTFADDHGKAA